MVDNCAASIVAILPKQPFQSRYLIVFLVLFTEVDENMVQCVDILTSYITKLRTLMIRFPHKPSGVVSQPWDSEDNLPQMDQRHWEAFDTEVSRM